MNLFGNHDEPKDDAPQQPAQGGNQSMGQPAGGAMPPMDDQGGGVPPVADSGAQAGDAQDAPAQEDAGDDMPKPAGDTPTPSGEGEEKKDAWQ